jgi:methionyl-tRNA synthetase
MAKDIVWFHGVIWPALLLALDLPLPKKIFVHGFFTVDNQKMSKSIGNVLDPNYLVDKFGVDAVRYATLREFPFGEDGDFSEEKIATHYNNLANNIGNLLQRTISMINKYNIEVKSNNTEAKSQKIDINAEISTLDFMSALKKIDDFCMAQNKYIAESEPWTLAKEDKKAELAEVLINVYNNLALLPELLEPFMPETAVKIRKQLETLEPEPLFPRLI